MMRAKQRHSRASTGTVTVTVTAQGGVEAQFEAQRRTLQAHKSVIHKKRHGDITTHAQPGQSRTQSLSQQEGAAHTDEMLLCVMADAAPAPLRCSARLGTQRVHKKQSRSIGMGNDQMESGQATRNDDAVGAAALLVRPSPSLTSVTHEHALIP